MNTDSHTLEEVFAHYPQYVEDKMDSLAEGMYRPWTKLTPAEFNLLQSYYVDKDYAQCMLAHMSAEEQFMAIGFVAMSEGRISCE